MNNNIRFFISISILAILTIAIAVAGFIRYYDIKHGERSSIQVPTEKKQQDDNSLKELDRLKDSLHHIIEKHSLQHNYSHGSFHLEELKSTLQKLSIEMRNNKDSIRLFVDSLTNGEFLVNPDTTLIGKKHADLSPSLGLYFELAKRIVETDTSNYSYFSYSFVVRDRNSQKIKSRKPMVSYLTKVDSLDWLVGVAITPKSLVEIEISSNAQNKDTNDYLSFLILCGTIFSLVILTYCLFLYFDKSKAERELKQMNMAATKYLEAINEADSAIAILNKERQFEWTNVCYREWQGNKDMNLVNQDLLTISSEPESAKSEFHKALISGFGKYNSKLGDRDVETNLKLLSNGQGIILVDKDKTKEKELNRLNEIRDSLFKLIGHELMNVAQPLRVSVSSFIDNPVVSNAKTIRYSYKEFELVLQNLLSLSKMERSSIELTTNACYIDSIIQENIELVEDKAADKNVRIVKTKMRKNLKIKGDYNIISLVFRNILSNAVKFTEGTRNRVGMIRIYAEIIDGKVVCSVSDTGPGVPEHLESLLFYESISSNTGLGIGLSICRRLLTFINGDIWYTKAQYRGSIFSFSLPYIKN